MIVSNIIGPISTHLPQSIHFAFEWLEVFSCKKILKKNIPNFSRVLTTLKVIHSPYQPEDEGALVRELQLLPLYPDSRCGTT